MWILLEIGKDRTQVLGINVKSVLKDENTVVNCKCWEYGSKWEGMVIRL